MIAYMPFKRSQMQKDTSSGFTCVDHVWDDNIASTSPWFDEDGTVASMPFLWTYYDDMALAFEQWLKKEKKRIRDWPAQEVLRHPPKVIACPDGHRDHRPELRRKTLRCDRKGIGLRIKKEK